MDTRDLLERLKSGELGVEAVLSELQRPPLREIEHAVIDAHRALRQGVPEVIYGEGKSTEQLLSIARELVALKQNVLITRLAAEAAASLQAAMPGLAYNAAARVARFEPQPVKRREAFGVTAVVTAGTTDLAVAEEASETLAAVGLEVERYDDVGVAGLHRVLSHIDRLCKASAVICIAGMEGALPSVIGGLVRVPVIGVPTSVGYGTALAGFTPLFAMLTSCASGVTVVNIGNGFGAALAVHRLACSLEARPR